MSLLEQITHGRVKAPYKVVVYGTPGIGKSTFAASAPKPIFLGTEDGTAHLDAFRFPLITKWDTAMEAVLDLRADHDFKTLVVDTLDWLEPLGVDKICRENNVEALTDMPYGKGFAALVDLWREFIRQCELLITERGMNVVLLAHSQIKTFQDPEREPYDRYTMKLNHKVGGLVFEWASDVLFANYEVVNGRDPQTKRVRGVSTGERVLHTTYSAAFDAKNHHSLPPALPLSWDAYTAACDAALQGPEALMQSIEEASSLLPPDRAEKALAAAKAAADDAVKLAKILNRIKKEVEA